ncbi:MAG TPA: phosphoribosylanthranilate isomerase [Terriglobales bacterium]|nr:phosphoribosylanthranilate isomerase [Terriglobales bacterium]
MTWVKICGITNLEDALTAVEAGADAVGFVFYEKSPRKADVDGAREIIRELPKHIEKVGVFVDDEPEQIRETALKTGLTAVQLHGRRALDRVWNDTRPAQEIVGVAKLIPVIPGNSLKNGGVMISERVHDNVFALLFDSQLNGDMGGTGTTFDWRGTRAMVQVISLKLPVIVAGGLTPVNVSEAIRLLQPFGVDVSSGVEARPGKKDPAKVGAFIQAVRSANKMA